MFSEFRLIHYQKKMTGKTGFSQKDITIWADLLNIDKAEYGEYFFN